MEPVTEPLEDFEEVSTSPRLRAGSGERERERERESTKGPAEARERETMKQPRSLFTSRPRPLTENSFNKNKRKTNPGLRRRGLRGLRLDPFRRRRPLGALFLPRGGGEGPSGRSGRRRRQLPEAAAGAAARGRDARRRGRRPALGGAGFAVLRGGGREDGSP